jgi:hypothetical protein
MSDITIIYLTCNELPEEWARFQQEALLVAADGAPIISMSMKPISFGLNILQDAPKSAPNIYQQMLRAAKIATTPYVAVAEDDTLYPPGHFHFFRPKLDTFAYNQNRFSLFSWGDPTYSWRNRKANTTLIAPRSLLIEAIEERNAAKYPDVWVGEMGREKLERVFGVTVRPTAEVYSELSVVQINHENSTDDRQRRRRKRLGPIKAYNIPYWEEASELIKKFK